MKGLKLIPFIVLPFLLLSFSKKVATPPWEMSSKEEFNTAYTKATSWFSSNMNYKVDIKYSSFLGHDATESYDKSEGYYKRNKNNLHSSALGIITIQNDKLCMMVDTVNKIIVLNNPKAVNQTPIDAQSLSDLLDNVKSIKKQIVTKAETDYQLVFKANAIYSSYELKVNEKGLLMEMKYFYSKEIKMDEENPNSIKGKPRLEVAFSNYQTNVTFNAEKDFSEKVFFKEENKKIVLNAKYKDFELKDYRFPVKN